MGWVAFITHLIKTKFDTICRKQFPSTIQKIRGKYGLMKRGPNFEELTLFCIEVPKWMQLPQPNHLNHLNQFFS